MSKLSLAGLTVVLSMGAGVGGTAGAQSGAARVAAALDAYARGAYVEGYAQLRGKAPLRDTVRDVRDHMARWADADPILAARRRTVALAVTVELVREGVAGTPAEYAAARPLIEWMCAAIRKSPASDAERLFHLATIGLLQGADDEVTLLGRDVQIGARNGHLFHAADRFPWEPRLKLALMLTLPEMRVIGTRPMGRQVPVVGYSRSFMAAESPPEVLQTTISRLDALTKEPAIAHEAMLRRGVLRFMVGAPDAAQDFQMAADADEPFVRYLAHLMLGVSYERSGEARSAIGAYSLAVRATPGTAASMALASLLFREGRADEAAQVADDWARRPDTEDPWRQYQHGDYRLVGHVLSVLRGAR